MCSKYGEEEIISVPLPDNKYKEMYAVVKKVLTGSRMNVLCEDGKSRLARVPGGKRRGLGRIKRNDLLIISPWDIQNEKADIVYKYRKYQVKFLSERHSLPEAVDIF
jgi:translation initiation factor 1A